MLKIGITGGIGSGKSLICKVFESFKVPVYYADDEAKKILNVDKKLIAQVKSVFGKNVYNRQSILNRKLLAEKVFNDKNKLEQLNSFVHPAVANHFKQWMKMNKKFPYIVKEAALLYESKTYLQLDEIIAVYAPEKLRIKRVIDRDGTSLELVRKIIRNQLSDKEKMKRADYIIYNDDKKLLLPQILFLHKKFLSLSNKMK